MNLLERFLKYVKINTMSDDRSGTTPSTSHQFDLANELVGELKELGLVDVFVNDLCTVFGTLPKNTEGFDKIGLLAHMDTIPGVSGENVKPKVIDSYDGSVINLGNNEVLDPNDFLELKNKIGHQLVTTSGDTVLGADDKAGIAIIMTAIEEIINNNLAHGEIHVAFTPDEEIGTGILSFDTSKFKVDYAYTLDGGALNELSYENFNAAHAIVNIKGFDIHPGSAKGKMINSIKVAMEFQSLLPVFDAPEYTSGYEGFNHPDEITGQTGHTTITYILRNHDISLLERQKNDFINARDFINKKYGEGTCTVDIKDDYRNMRELIEKDSRSVDKAIKAYKDLGIDVTIDPIRGGTDGARLTFMGINTPNLATGGYNYHGIHEYADVTEMKTMVEIVKTILTSK